MSNLWAMRGIKKMLMDKRLNKPRLKHRSYQLKSRSWMRQLTAKGNRIEHLEAERDELAKQLEQHQWISVKDKLPENNSGLFLCFGHEKTLFVCHRKHHEWFRSPQLQRVVGISHWMQIKPPEAE